MGAVYFPGYNQRGRHSLAPDPEVEERSISTCDSVIQVNFQNDSVPHDAEFSNFKRLNLEEPLEWLAQMICRHATVFWVSAWSSLW